MPLNTIKGTNGSQKFDSKKGNGRSRGSIQGGYKECDFGRRGTTGIIPDVQRYPRDNATDNNSPKRRTLLAYRPSVNATIQACGWPAAMGDSFTKHVSGEPKESVETEGESSEGFASSVLANLIGSIGTHLVVNAAAPNAALTGPAIVHGVPAVVRTFSKERRQSDSTGFIQKVDDRPDATATMRLPSIAHARQQDSPCQALLGSLSSNRESKRWQQTRFSKDKQVSSPNSNLRVAGRLSKPLKDAGHEYQLIPKCQEVVDSPISRTGSKESMRSCSKDRILTSTLRRSQINEFVREHFRDLPCMNEVAARYEFSRLPGHGNDSKEAFSQAVHDRMQEAFARFLATSTSWNMKVLNMAVSHVGFSPKESGEVAKLQKQILCDDGKGFMTFVAYVTLHAEVELQEVKAAFDLCGCDDDQTVDIHQLEFLMRNVGFIITREEVDELLPLTFPTLVPRRINFDRFLYMLAVHRSMEGFVSQAMLERAGTSFHLYSADKMWLQTSLLKTALLDLFGLSAADNVKDVMYESTHPSAKTNGEFNWPYSHSRISQREFLVWVRRVHELERKKDWDLFQLADANGNSSIDEEELGTVMEKLGYTPLTYVVRDFLFEARKCTKQRALDFGAFIGFLEAVNERQGFTSRETRALMDKSRVFQQDAREFGEGGMPFYNLFRLISWLGHEIKVEEFVFILKEEDVGTDRVNSSHLLRIFRRLREAELITYKKALLPLLHGEEEEIQADLAFMALCNYNATDFPLDNEMFIAEAEGLPATFDSAVVVIDSCREEFCIQRRFRAGFSLWEVSVINDLYEEVTAGDMRGLRVQEQLPWLLSILGVPMQNKERREWLLKCATDGAQDALDDNSFMLADSPKELVFMVFPILLHGLRRVADSALKPQVKSEIETMMQLNFSTAELVEFREVFCSYADVHEEPPKVELSKRHHQYISQRMHQSQIPSKKPEHEIVRISSKDKWSNQKILWPSFGVARMSKEAIWNLLHRKGMPKGNTDEYQALQQKVTDLDDTSKGVCFPGFLRLMRWVVDFNYGDINSQIAKTE